MTEELKPCPFCGAPGRLFEMHQVGGSEVECSARCELMEATTPGAIAKWNTRAEPDYWYKKYAHLLVEMQNGPGQQALELLRESPLEMQPLARVHWNTRRKALLEKKA